VLYRNPDADRELPSHILPTTYICRYSLSIGDNEENPELEIIPYTGENDEWHEMTLAAVQKKQNTTSDDDDEEEHRNRAFLDTASAGNSSSAPNGSGSDEDTESAMSIEDSRKRKRGDAEEGIDEGTTEQRYIKVGKEHQVLVPPFVPNQKSVSRHPIKVWEPGTITQEKIDEYMDEVSKILTPYLRDRRLTQEEAYSPFPTARMEELSQTLAWNRLPTLSSVSTSSSLSTKKVDALREFDCDALLRNLHSCNCDIQAALSLVQSNPRNFSTIWLPQEKNVFDNGFRRYSGSLRAIFKGMGSKDLQQVIDYHYRFKIPDQFRRFQERKREQAVRMLECIETRRSLNAPILMPKDLKPQNTTEDQKESKDWYVHVKALSFFMWTVFLMMLLIFCISCFCCCISERFDTSSTSAAVSVEERRAKAKELLLDVESQLGRTKVIQIFELVKESADAPLVESKTRLMELLRGHKDLQQRFHEFLPKQLQL
jgi:hypothetical protein